MNLRERFMANAFVYKTLQNIIAPSRLGQETVADFLISPPKSKVLDLGCGFGWISQYFHPDIDYLGIDSNESYIAEAVRRFKGTNRDFMVGDISDSEILDRGPFDLVFLTGVLHHLSSAQVSNICTASSKLVSKSGRFVAIEPVFSPDQGLIPRLIIAADRGRYVRDTEGYESLLSLGFENVSSKVIHGRLRIPYSHVILTATH
jgi:SAM-dependent methyltransferase